MGDLEEIRNCLKISNGASVTWGHPSSHDLSLTLLLLYDLSFPFVLKTTRNRDEKGDLTLVVSCAC